MAREMIVTDSTMRTARVESDGHLRFTLPNGDVVDAGVALGEAVTDAGIAAQIADAESQTAAQLNVTIGAAVGSSVSPLLVGMQSLALASRENWTVGLGDSNTAVGADPVHRYSMFEQACAISHQQITRLANAGVSGERIDQMLARVSSVIALRPGRVIFMGGTNDATVSARTLPLMLADTRAIFDKLATAGIAVAVVSTPPINDVTAIKQKVTDWNAMLAAECAARSIPFVDIHTPLSDGSGGWAAGKNRDNLHFSEAGAIQAGQIVADALSGRWLAGSPLHLATENVDAGSILVNGIFEDTNADGKPDGWTVPSAPTVAAVTLAPAMHGNWLQVERLGPGGSYTVNRVITTGFAAGDEIEFSARMKPVSGAVVANLYCNITDAASAQLKLVRPVRSWTIDREIVVTQRAVIPAGATRIDVHCHTEGGTGTVAFGQVTVAKI